MMMADLANLFLVRCQQKMQPVWPRPTQRRLTFSLDNVEGLEEIEFVLATEYAGMVEGIIAGRIDVAQFGPFAYVIATKNGANLEVAGAAIRKQGAAPGYRSYLVTGKDSGISSLEDLAGRSVCFTDPGSTSGFLFPSEGLLSVGLDPSEGSTDITPIFAGGHDRINLERRKWGL